MIFDSLKHTAKAALGVVFSPVDVAADILTLGGSLTDSDEPYTVKRMRGVMRNLDLAADPDQFSDDQIRSIIEEIKRKESR